MRILPSFPLVLAVSFGSCGFLPQSGGEYVNTPYISRTTGTGVAGAGELEYEGLIEVDPDQRVKSIVKVLAGLGPGFEFFLGWSPYLSAGVPGSRGSGDLTIGSKYQFADGSHGRPRAVVEVSSRLPTSDVGPAGGDGEADFFLLGAAGQAFGVFSLVGTYELGMLGESGNDSVVLEHNAVLAGTYQVNHALRTFTEVSMVYVPSADEWQWFGGTGGGLRLTEHFEAQAALQVGLNADAPDYLLVLGFNFGAGTIFPVWRE